MPSRQHGARLLQLQICFVVNRMNATDREWLKDVNEKQLIILKQGSALSNQAIVIALPFGTIQPMIIV
jgi:hypothetical protein